MYNESTKHPSTIRKSIDGVTNMLSKLLNNCKLLNDTIIDINCNDTTTVCDLIQNDIDCPDCPLYIENRCAYDMMEHYLQQVIDGLKNGI